MAGGEIGVAVDVLVAGCAVEGCHHSLFLEAREREVALAAVALGALDEPVLPGERECGLRMIELRGLPRGRHVALLTVGELRLAVGILVARRAQKGCRNGSDVEAVGRKGEVVTVTGGAFVRPVGSGQCKCGVAPVIEAGDVLPALLPMTLLALGGESVPMR